MVPKWFSSGFVLPAPTIRCYPHQHLSALGCSAALLTCQVRIGRIFLCHPSTPVTKSFWLLKTSTTKRHWSLEFTGLDGWTGIWKRPFSVAGCCWLLADDDPIVRQWQPTWMALLDVTIEYDGLCKLWTVLHGSNFGKYLKISQKMDGFVTS